MNDETRNLEAPGGLHPLPEDSNDFSLAAVFGTAPVEELPEEYEIPPLYFKNQKKLDFCSTFAGTEVSEDQERVELCPLFQFMVTKEIAGNPQTWGANLRDMCQSFVKVGSIEQKDSPYTIDTPREHLVNPDNWPYELRDKAAIHRKESFFSVFKDSPYDAFDAIRSALWKHREEKRTIVVGAYWRHKSWTRAKNGIVPDDLKPEDYKVGNYEGHAFKVFGWEIKRNPTTGKREPYLKAQNSWGDEIGDDGVFYFSRLVVDRDFPIFGAYMFKDITKEKAEYYIKYGISIEDGRLVALYKKAITLAQQLLALLLGKSG